MEQFILMFGLDKDKEKAVRTVCSRIGAVPVTVERRDYSQKLGTLAGVQGFSRDKTVYSGPNFPAIVTPHNVFWTAEALFKELLKEHLHMSK